MHQLEVAQGFIERCQARNTDSPGDLPGHRIHRSNLCDYEQQHVAVLLGEQSHTWPAADVSPPTAAMKLQAHYQNCAAWGVGVTTEHQGGTPTSQRASS